MIMEPHYSWPFVVASVLISTFTAYVAMETASRIPEHITDHRVKWIIISSLCLGGGIWAMHFVAMLGYVVPMPVNYDMGLTFLSLVVPIVVAAIGFHLIFKSAELTWRRNITLGGVYGLAIVAMHYTGMAAMEMDATMEWNYFIVFLSFVVAFVAATAAIRASFYRLGLIQALVGSVLMGIAISGMHYTGMAALTMVSHSEHEYVPAALSIGREQLGAWVTIVTFAILMVGLITASHDRHKMGEKR